MFFASLYTDKPQQIIDTRIKLFYTVLMIIITTSANEATALGCFLITSGCLILFNRTKTLLLILIFNLAFWFLFRLLLIDTTQLGFSESEFFAGMVLKATAITAISLWFALSTSIYNMSAALEKMRVPPAITLPLLIAVRFLPTLYHEQQQIREAMYIRRIYTGWTDFLNKPLIMLRYLLLPLLIRSIRMSEELAAAGEARGITRPAAKSYLDAPSIGRNDLIFLTVNLLLLAEILFLGST